MRILPFSVPQPDVIVAPNDPARYRSDGIQPGDVLLIIEVSDMTLRYDRTVKVPLYARAGIAESWVVDVKRERVFVYREPHDGSYRTLQTLGVRDTITPLASPDLRVAVADFMPVG
jgi:Uma2 family endonuclease